MSVSALIAYVAGALYLLARILSATHGHFTYTLDDPYIHLALSERIRHGLYGLNAGEPASPSSSVLWPFLFVPFAGTRPMVFLPLILNIVFGCIAAWCLGALVDRYVRRGPLEPRQVWLAHLLGVLLVLATNLLGLTFLGLEQLLETLLCIGCAYLLIATAERTRISQWCIAAVILLPLVLYEGLLVTFAVVFALACLRQWKLAGIVLVASTVPVLLFSLFLQHLGLPLVPMSVMVKRVMVSGEGSGWQHLMSVMRVGLEAAKLDPERYTTALLLVTSTGTLLYLRRSRRHAAVLLAVSGFTLVQLLFGPFGWFYRYEMYCINFALPILLACSLGQWGAERQDLSPGSDTRRERPALGLLCVATGAIVLHYLQAFTGTPNAAQSVFREQGQLARLTTDFYPGPVAVNDLGMVSFHRTSQQYVLDLAALGSPEVFRTRLADRTPAWLDAVAAEHHIGLVAIYPEWFKVLPQDWTPVAKLCAQDAHYGPATPRVMLYETAEADEATLLQALTRFKATLEPGTLLELHPHDQSLTCQP